MSDSEKILHLDPLIITYLRDMKVTKSMEDFVIEKFLDVCHERSASDGKYSTVNFDSLVQPVFYTIVDWQEDSVKVRKYTMFELLKRPVISTAERILGRLAQMRESDLPLISQKIKDFFLSGIFS